MEYDTIYDNWDERMFDLMKSRDEQRRREEEEKKQREEEAKIAEEEERKELCRCTSEYVCKCESYMIRVSFYMKHKLIFIKNYSELTEVRQLKVEMSNLLKIPVENIQLLRWHVFLNDTKTLEFLTPPADNRNVEIVVVNTGWITPSPAIIGQHVVPDIITVRVETEDIFKDITVEIENRSIQKPYLGGYKNNESELEYHHANTQTGPANPKVEPEYKNHRDTQTIETRNRKIEQSYSRATQMSNEECFIATNTDKILVAKKYETAEEVEKKGIVLKAVLTIQRYFRRWKLKKALKALRAKYREMIENEEDEKREKMNEFEDQKIKEINAKTFPRTRDDFNMLYSMVDRWKKAQIERISTNFSGSAKLAEFYLLLNKEIEMLAAIEKHRQRMKREMKDIELMRFFKAISDPVKWQGYKNYEIEMDTLETQQGKEYKNLFYEACNLEKSPEERLEYLKVLKESCGDHNCVLWNKLLQLIKREEEMILHNIDDKSMDMLRKRIEQLLLKHIKLDECNNGVTRRMNRLEQKAFKCTGTYCSRCGQIKPNKDFPLINSRHLVVKSCTSCSWLDRVEEPWFEPGPYRLMLRTIRRDERKRNNHTSVAYILQEKDIYYIVTRIWHSKSIISETSNISELRLCRWKKDEEWTPWNTILLTDKEMECHLNVEVLENVYDEEFITSVMDKNVLGRVIFANTLFLRDKFIEDQDEKKEREDIILGGKKSWAGIDPELCE